MKNLLIRSIVLFSGLLFATPFGISQVSYATPPKRELQARLQKTEYLLLEPIAVEFRLTGPSYDLQEGLVRAVSITVKHTGVATEYDQLTWNIIEGFPQPSLRKPPESLQPHTPMPVRFASDHVIIDRAEVFFPVAGEYEVQFWLPDPDGKIIRSKVVELSIKEPTGIDREAWQFLAKREMPMSLGWVWTEKDGFKSLEMFVEKYGRTAYGDLAIRLLGSSYLLTGELDKSAAEFQKLKTSAIPEIREYAVKSLSIIAAKKAALKKPQSVDGRR